MNESEFNELWEKSWNQSLSSEEDALLRAWLDAHPEVQPAWQEDVNLSRMLGMLPEIPVSSNFTSRVLQCVDREEMKSRRQMQSGAAISWKTWFKHWLPKSAVAFLVLALGLVSFRVYEEQRRADLYKGVRLVRTMAALPHPEALQDFEAIQSLSAVPPVVDLELLAALE